MGFVEEQEKFDADRRSAHREYMLTMSELKEAREDFEELRIKIPQLEDLAKRRKARRDRLDEEYKTKYGNEAVNTKKTKLEKLKAQIEKLQKEVRYHEGHD
jgi:uncharacterized protein YwgA